MRVYITQEEKEYAVYKAFNDFISKGKTKTQATYAVMRLFKR